MRLIYLASVWIHLIAAAVWIGGAAFIALALVPEARKGALGTVPLRAIVMRFRAIGWTCLAVLLATGYVNLRFRGIGLAELFTGEAFRGSAGHALALKLACVGLMAALSAYHDFRLGPAAARALERDPASPEALRGRRRAGLFGRAVLLLALSALAAAAVFVRGGF